MKRTLLTLVLFSTITLFGQNRIKPEISGFNILGTEVNFKSNYRKAELSFANGEKKVGYIYGFIQNKAVSFSIKNPFSGPIDALNLNEKSFEFKEDLDQSATKILSSEMSEVAFLDGDSAEDLQRYKLVDLATVNSDGTIKNLDKKAWLPYYSKGKVNLFSFNVYERDEDSKGRATGYYTRSTTTVYLNNSSNNVAINAMDVGITEMFSRKRISGKLSGALIEVFKDCPEFVKANLDEKGFWDFDSAYFEIDEYEKEKMQEIKADKTLKGNQKAIRRDRLEADLQLLPYLRMIEAYNKVCQ